MTATLPEIPGYDVEAELGRGGMGVVYRVRRHSNGQTLALKMLLRQAWEATDQELARFRIEAEALACLNHPHIVKIRDIGVVRGVPYFAMVYAEGGSLAQAIAAARPEPSAAARLVRSLAEAVHHAHERSLLHRDLKPSNVLIHASGSPMISDFGLVKFRDPVEQVRHSYSTISSVSSFELEQSRFGQELRAQYRSGPVDDATTAALWDQCARRTGVLDDSDQLKEVQSFVDAVRAQRDQAASLAEETRFDGGATAELRPRPLPLDDLTNDGAVMGSPHYMAPEQAAGQLDRIGPATDVYALGGILYEMLTGRPPFQGTDRFRMLMNVVADAPTPPGRLVADLPEALDSICLTCLAKRPDDRYATADELADDLGRFLGGLAPRRSPPPQPPAPSVPPPAFESPTITMLKTRPDASPARSRSATRSWWPFTRSN